MKSIKPGRGRSFMEGLGAIASVVFGIPDSLNTPFGANRYAEQARDGRGSCPCCGRRAGTGRRFCKSCGNEF